NRRRLLSLVELMGVWNEGMLSKRYKTKKKYSQLLNDGEPIDDPIYDVLKERKERFSKAREIMLDGEVTGFIFVLNPEQLPIEETKNAIEMLDQYHLHVRTLIVNRVLPTEETGHFFAQRKAYEAQQLKRIKADFSDKQRISVTFFPHDIINLAQLGEFAKYLT